MRYEALRLRCVSVEDYKYGGISDATFSVCVGEVVLLAGLFHSGVKTLCRLLGGRSGAPHGGELAVLDRTVQTATVESMLENGVAVIGTDPLIFENMSLRDNLSIYERKKGMFGVVRRRHLDRYVHELADICDIDLDRQDNTGLTRFERFKFETLKMYAAGMRVLVFSGVLTYFSEDELAEFTVIAAYLKRSGLTLLIDIVNGEARPFEEVADRCIVFRNGMTTTAVYKDADGHFDERRLRYVIVGGKSPGTSAHPEEARHAGAGARLRFRRLGSDAAFETNGPAIVGVCDESSKLPMTTGELIEYFNEHYELLLDGSRAVFSAPFDLIKLGIAVIPNETADRMIFPNLSPVENVCMYAQRLFGKRVLYDWDSARYMFNRITRKYAMLAGCAELAGRGDSYGLSYSRVFELMVAKLLAANPSVVVMFSQFYSSDLRRAADMRELQRELAAEGKTVFVVSPDANLLHRLCGTTVNV